MDKERLAKLKKVGTYAAIGVGATLLIVGTGLIIATRKNVNDLKAVTEIDGETIDILTDIVSGVTDED